MDFQAVELAGNCGERNWCHAAWRVGGMRGKGEEEDMTVDTGNQCVCTCI